MLRPPYREATHNTWRVESAEGFFAHFIGNERLCTSAGAGAELNTDDRTPIEFGFARTVGSDDHFDVNELISTARALGADRPARVRGSIDWNLVDLNRWMYEGLALPALAGDLVRARHQFTAAYGEDDFSAARQAWRNMRWGAVNTAEVSRLAEVLAEEGSDEAEIFIMLLRDMQPVEAMAIEARMRMMQGSHDEAAQLIEKALIGYRTDVWPSTKVMGRALNTAVVLAATDRPLASRMLSATSRSFPAGQFEDERRLQRVRMAWGAELGCGPKTVAALREIEPHVPWTEEHLRRRRLCYARAGLLALHAAAERDWQEFRKTMPQPLLVTDE
jgi:hypothetical protein